MIDGIAKEKLFDDLTASILTPGGLLEQAEVTLKRAVENDPHNIATLQQLATILRCRGDLQAAAETYRRLGELHPDDDRAHYLHSVLAGRHTLPTAAPHGVWPAPFVRFEKFLLRPERDLVLELALQHQGDLEVAKVGEGVGDYKPQRRSSLILSRKVDKLVPWFLPRVKAVLPAVLRRLQIAPFPIREIELQMTVHRRGGHYKVHQDGGKGIYTTRRVTYVYYFHRLPKRFTGGDLLLYDTDVHDAGYAAAFTRLEAVDNSIVFFPSDYFHQVTAVHCESFEFGDSRFTLNGWFHPIPTEDNT
jgi:hypothetical protein